LRGGRRPTSPFCHFDRGRKAERRNLPYHFPSVFPLSFPRKPALECRCRGWFGGSCHSRMRLAGIYILIRRPCGGFNPPQADVVILNEVKNLFFVIPAKFIRLRRSRNPLFAGVYPPFVWRGGFPARLSFFPPNNQFFYPLASPVFYVNIL